MTSAVAERTHTLETMLRVAREASTIVMEIYAGDFAVEYKAKNDPVTRADREANALICDALERAFPGVPIVAEESEPVAFETCRTKNEIFFVDPVDGTREFIAKNGEFAIMIGLAEAGRASLGVLVCPALARTFVGGEGLGAWEVKPDGRVPIRVSDVRDVTKSTLLTSRSHKPPQLAAMLARLKPGKETPCGSSGVKGSRIAAGEADIYMQPGPAGKRWDACAPEAIIRAAGGIVTDVWGNRFDYATADLVNGHGLLATNGFLHDAVLEAVRAFRALPE
jgi:3'(2'), 5'-bisphosphate nucleotidase